MNSCSYVEVMPYKGFDNTIKIIIKSPYTLYKGTKGKYIDNTLPIANIIKVITLPVSQSAIGWPCTIR